MKDTSTRMPIGITDTSYGVYGPRGRYDKIREDGYDCIDYQGFVNIETEFFGLADEDFARAIAEEREYIEARDLKVAQAHSPWRYPTKDADPEERSAWIAAMKKAIRGTHLLGATRFVVHPLIPYQDCPDRPDEVIAMNEEFFATLADYAKDYGVTVCMENMPFEQYPLSTVEATCALVDKLNRENLKVCLDTGHAAIFDADVAGAVRYVGDRLCAVHIHDNMGDTDSHLIPGDGVIDWDAFSHALGEIGFCGVVSIETSPKHGSFPKEQWHDREVLLSNIAKDIATKVKNSSK